MRRLSLSLAFFLMCTGLVFGQAGTGSITGTVLDPGGAVVAGASVDVKNSETGVVYPSVTTNTGNYTLAQLPPGIYEVTVTVSGFKKYVHANLQVQAAQTVREDPRLELGSGAESITITAEASLLKTESGDLAHNISVESLDQLPILGIGGANAGSSGIRNPYGLANLIPGVDYVANNTMVINGAPNNTAGYRIEGQDMTNHFVGFALQEMQPGADAIQEVAVQTSNYSAEYGVAGGGLFNITMKSGTNQYHGSAYDYFVNEDLNAAYPFSFSGNGNKVRPRNRRNDYGGTLGGAVKIPKLYDGHNRTFFFFNWEEFLESTALNFPLTLPSAAYRKGDFSSISVNGGAGFNTTLGVPTGALPSVDGLGRPILANTIYDPGTERLGNNGVLVRDPFPGNIIPVGRIAPSSAKIQALFPNPTSASTTNNAVGSNLSQRTTIIPSLKIDESVGNKGKVSFFWSKTYTDSQYSTPNGNADGLPAEISQARGTFFHYWVTRLNYDHTLTPRLLGHLGIGYSQIYAPDDAPFLTFNAQKEIGLSGFQANRNFPNISGMCAAPPPGANGCGGSLGGMQTVGTSAGIQGHPHPQNKPTANANLTWIRGNHSYKGGAEVYWQGSIQNPFPAVLLVASATSNSGATALPFSPPNGLAGSAIGFGYANFLLGDYTSVQQNTGADYRLGKSQWAVFIQDSWKVNRKLTFDYGLRWDYGTYAREEYGRSANLDTHLANPGAGGRLGATVFEATCNCRFANNYPYAIGPRLGVAYQINSKTVLRAGIGIVYSYTPDVNGSAALSATNSVSSPGQYINLEAPGAIPQPVWPVFNPGLYPSAVGSTATAPQALDPNAGRPPRQTQWSIGLQREISSNLVIEASYLGNRGVWWSAGIGSGVNLGLLEQVSPATFAAAGLNPYTNSADNILLSSAINSSAVISRFGGKIPLPYTGFPVTGTLLNALRPYPQFSSAGAFGLGALALSDVPSGKTWYDALQAKVTKRYSRGLQASGTFTWSKALVNTREDFFNPASSSKTFQTTDQPFLLNANIVYTVPKVLTSWKYASWAVRDWQFGAFVQYGSGLPLTPPSSTATNNLAGANGATNYQVRVSGQPLYLKDLNCHCINPYTDQMLNPLAWANPAAGTWGGNALYGDFRSPRRPQENFNIGRNFRFKERMNFQIRAEFVNIFNRTYLGNPSTSNPQNPLGRNQLGQLTSGFGVVNATVGQGGLPTVSTTGPLFLLPRTGTLIARFSF